MGLVELALLFSALLNGWQFYDRGKLTEELEVKTRAAVQCQQFRHKIREDEYESEDRRQEIEVAIRGIDTPQQFDVGEGADSDCRDLRSTSNPRHRRVVDEEIRRIRAINRVFSSDPSD